jgi:hypothetical protein
LELLKGFCFSISIGYFALFPDKKYTHLEMQAQTLQRFSRFERAIARREPKLAMLIAVEMQEMALEWQKEVCEWTNRKYPQ